MTFKWDHSGREVYIVVIGAATFINALEISNVSDNNTRFNCEQFKTSLGQDYTKVKMSPVYSRSNVTKGSG